MAKLLMDRVKSSMEEKMIMDNYRDKVMELHEKQSAKGMSKYGIPLEEYNSTMGIRIAHLQEELMDALHYTFWMMEMLPEAPKVEQRVCQDCNAVWCNKGNNIAAKEHCLKSGMEHWGVGIE